MLLSADIEGRQAPPVGMSCRSCISTVGSGWECPRRYAQVFTPGFDAMGHRAPSAWIDSNFTDAAKQALVDSLHDQ